MGHGTAAERLNAGTRTAAEHLRATEGSRPRKILTNGRGLYVARTPAQGTHKGRSLVGPEAQHRTARAYSAAYRRVSILHLWRSSRAFLWSSSWVRAYWPPSKPLFLFLLLRVLCITMSTTMRSLPTANGRERDGTKTRSADKRLRVAARLQVTGTQQFGKDSVTRGVRRRWSRRAAARPTA